MDKPAKEEVEALKSKHSGKSIHLCSLKRPDDDEMYYVVMVGADYDEYKLYQEGIAKAREDGKTAADKNERAAFAAKSVVLRLCVWPEKHEVAALLQANPGFIIQLSGKIDDHAGATAEVRSEKL